MHLSRRGGSLLAPAAACRAFVPTKRPSAAPAGLLDEWPALPAAVCQRADVDRRQPHQRRGRGAQAGDSEGGSGAAFEYIHLRACAHACAHARGNLLAGGSCGVPPTRRAWCPSVCHALTTPTPTPTSRPPHTREIVTHLHPRIHALLQVYAALSPEQKLARVAKLKESGRGVIMVSNPMLSLCFLAAHMLPERFFLSSLCGCALALTRTASCGCICVPLNCSVGGPPRLWAPAHLLSSPAPPAALSTQLSPPAGCALLPPPSAAPNL